MGEIEIHVRGLPGDRHQGQFDPGKKLREKIDCLAVVAESPDRVLEVGAHEILEESVHPGLNTGDHQACLVHHGQLFAGPGGIGGKFSLTDLDAFHAQLGIESHVLLKCLMPGGELTDGEYGGGGNGSVEGFGGYAL